MSSSSIAACSRAVRRARSTTRAHSSFLYPFLSEGETALEPVIEDVRSNVLMKAEEVGELRERTLTEGREALLEAAGALRECFQSGRKALVFGNGGSATDAMDLVADLRGAPQGWPARAAIDLTEDPSILTAIANDVGVEPIFSRQVIAYGRRETLRSRSRRAAAPGTSSKAWSRRGGGGW